VFFANDGVWVIFVLLGKSDGSKRFLIDSVSKVGEGEWIV
jgi:hypothetical protein